MAAFFPSSPHYGFPFGSSPSPSARTAGAPSRLVVVSSAFGLGGGLVGLRHKQLRRLLCSSFQEVCQSHFLSPIDTLLSGRPLKKCFGMESLVETWLAIQTPWWFSFKGKESKKSNDDKKLDPDTSPGKSFDGRLWTNVLLALNVLTFVAQIATQGRLLLWGAKVNNLINEGQIWRLATSSFLHADILHLMVNCYSLNSVGPTVEKFCGSRRFLTVYLGSAIASSAMSYWFSPSPAVGASGAIFGLVGSTALFMMRHRRLLGAGKHELMGILQVIVLNMAIGLSVTNIDNWGHVGGLLGGAAISWFLGPALRYESRPDDGRPFLVDRAPIFSLLNNKKRN